jgi:hypothetical protein
MKKSDRKIVHHTLEHTNVMAQVVYDSYSRILRTQSAGLTEQELNYLHRRVVAYKTALDQMSTLRRRIRASLT